MKILEELWYGNISPRGEVIRDPRVVHIVPLVTRNDAALREMLSAEQLERYEKLRDCQDELADLMERNAFIDGFCLAAKIMIEVMEGTDPPEIDS